MTSSAPLSRCLCFWHSSQAISARVFSFRAFSRRRRSPAWCLARTSSSFIKRTISDVNWENESSPENGAEENSSNVWGKKGRVKDQSLFIAFGWRGEGEGLGLNTIIQQNGHNIWPEIIKKNCRLIPLSCPKISNFCLRHWGLTVI